MSEIFTNLARSTLASGITSVATSLTVQSGDGNDLFPATSGADNFRCVLFKKSTGDIEIINVTVRAGDVFTISRAQEQIGNLTATAFAFDAGDIIEHRPTGAFFNSLSAGASSENIQHGTFIYGVDTGAADVYQVAMNPTAITIQSGQEVRVKIGAGNTNTGIAVTLQLDATAAQAVVMEGGGNPPAGSIVAGYVHTFEYDGVNFIFKPVGLALTSTGFNAQNKQIKNVAAGTAANDVATIGLAETLALKTLTSPVINTGISGTAVDTDNTLVADSDTLIVSQKAIKSYVENSINAVSFKGCLVYGSSQTIPATNVAQLILFPNESYDTDAIHSTVSNTGRLIVPAGVTRIKLTANIVWFGGSSNSEFTGEFRKNGSINQVIGCPSRLNAWGIMDGSIASSVLAVTAGDYFELWLRTGVTSSEQLSSTTSFSMEIRNHA